MGSEFAPTTEVESSADVESLTGTSLVVVVGSRPVLERRRLTTRVFFFRVVRVRPAPKGRPVVAEELRLVAEGREGMLVCSGWWNP